MRYLRRFGCRQYEILISKTIVGDTVNGDKGIRTPDLLNAIQTRSQLRHTPRYEYYNTRHDGILQGFYE